jgi:hypothetical protein
VAKTCRLVPIAKRVSFGTNRKAIKSRASGVPKLCPENMPTGYQWPPHRVQGQSKILSQKLNLISAAERPANSPGWFVVRLAEVPASAAQPVITRRHPSCSLTGGPTSNGHGPFNPPILAPMAARQDYLHPASNPALHTDRGYLDRTSTAGYCCSTVNKTSCPKFL